MYAKEGISGYMPESLLKTATTGLSMRVSVSSLYMFTCINFVNLSIWSIAPLYCSGSKTLTNAHRFTRELVVEVKPLAIIRFQSLG